MAAPIRITLRVSSDDADDQQIDEMTRQLREQLLATDVVIDQVAGGQAPPGSKAVIELAALGGLLLTLSQSPVLASIIAAVAGWLKQRRDGKVRVEIGSDVLELTGQPTAQQTQMAEEFLRRHSTSTTAGVVAETLAPTGVSPAAGARTGQRNALLVASWQFDDPGLQQLRAPAHDVAGLAEVLGNPAIGGFGVRTVVNQPAPVINEAVEEFFDDRDPDELLLLYFSGHGIKDADGDLYLAAASTKLNRLGATAIAADFINRRMSRSRSRRVVLLLDCCYAGAFGRGLVPRGGTGMAIGDQFNGRGRAVITASSSMEYAFEGQEVNDTGASGTSVFTTALIDGLATGDADRDQDGYVALDELYDYVYDRVREATPNQTPGKWTFDVQGDLYIARRSTPVSRPAPLPRELTEAVHSPLSGIREGAVVELARLLHSGHEGTALAARASLHELVNDDSRRVSAAAQAALATAAPTMPGAAVDPAAVAAGAPGGPAATAQPAGPPATAERSVAQPQPQTQPHTQPQAQPQTQPHTQAQAQPQTQPHTQAQAQPQSQLHVPPQGRPQAQPQAQQQPDSPAGRSRRPRSVVVRCVIAQLLFALAGVIVLISNADSVDQGIDLPANAWIFAVALVVAAAVPNRRAAWPVVAAIALGLMTGPLSALIPLNASDAAVSDESNYGLAVIGLWVALVAAMVALTTGLRPVHAIIPAIAGGVAFSFFAMVLVSHNAASGFMHGSNDSGALAYLAAAVLIGCAVARTALDLRIPAQRLSTAVGALVPLLMVIHFYTASTGDAKDYAARVFAGGLMLVLLGQATVSSATPGALAAVRLSVILCDLLLVEHSDPIPSDGARVMLLLLATAASVGAFLLSRARLVPAKES